MRSERSQRRGLNAKTFACRLISLPPYFCVCGRGGGKNASIGKSAKRQDFFRQKRRRYMSNIFGKSGKHQIFFRTKCHAERVCIFSFFLFLSFTLIFIRHSLRYITLNVYVLTIFYWQNCFIMMFFSSEMTCMVLSLQFTIYSHWP